MYVPSSHSVLPFPRPANFFVFTPNCVEALKKSLKRLGVDSVALYQVSGTHTVRPVADGRAPFADGTPLVRFVRQAACPMPETRPGKSHRRFEFQQRRIVRCVSRGPCGRWTLTPRIQMHDLLKKEGVQLASNQVEFSLLRRLPETSGLLAAMKERNIACLAYSPLGMGRLTGKYSSANPPPAGRRFASHYTWAQLDPLIDLLKELGDKYGVKPSAIALNWVIRKGVIPLGGARNGKQAEENAMATGFTLSDEDVKRLDRAGFEGKTWVLIRARELT